jgi:hypothetical protein
MVATLQRELVRLYERIDCLTRNRAAITGYLDTVLSVRSAVAEPAAAT